MQFEITLHRSELGTLAFLLYAAPHRLRVLLDIPPIVWPAALSDFLPDTRARNNVDWKDTSGYQAANSQRRACKLGIMHNRRPIMCENIQNAKSVIILLSNRTETIKQGIISVGRRFSFVQVGIGNGNIWAVCQLLAELYFYKVVKKLSYSQFCQ